MFFNGLLKKVNFLFFALLFAGSLAFSAEEAKRTVITIENALNTQYEKDKETGNDVVVLVGDVRISVTSGENKNVIFADAIRYDRTSEMMYASGNVSLEMTSASSGSQNVTADSLMFNTATLEGVFDDGRVVQTKSDAINLPSGSTLVVASDVFGRSESNTIAFKDGVLTFCDDEDPHWNIKASRIWLLPGGEFAFLNALLYVGVVPVFYFPAFYYPKDELIFNPVFGYKNRAGYFNQNTFYLFGRKPMETSTTTTSSDDSEGAEKLKALFNFIKPSSLKEQQREGLILHNLDADYKGDTSNYLKIMGDYYTNLGAMVGLDGIYKPKKYITNIEGKFLAGFSNTVFKVDDNYLPVYEGGQRYMDKSNLLGLELPFRYAANLKLSMSKPFNLSLALPVYSDPFFSNDFDQRNESMDWISYLLEATEDKKDDETINEISSFTWNASASYSVPLPSLVKPYISTLSMDLKSSMVFSSMSAKSSALTNDDITHDGDLAQWRTYTPLRKFYYPSQITPLTASMSLSGTLFNYSSSSTSSKTTSEKKAPAFVSPLEVPEELLTESQKAEIERKRKEEEERALAENNGQKAAGSGDSSLLAKSGKPSETAGDGKDSDGKDSEGQDEKESLLPLEAFPKLSGVSSSSLSIGGFAFSSKYSVKPNFTTQIAYNSSSLDTAEDFEWGEEGQKSRIYIFKLPVTLDNSLSYGGSFLSFSNSNSYSPVWQGHPYIHENGTDSEGKAETIWYSESSKTQLLKSDYTAHKQDITSSNSFSFKPFAYLSHFKDTGVTYRNSIKILRTEFVSDSVTSPEDEPEYDYNPIWEVIDEDDESELAKSITTHALDFTLALNEFDNKFTQSFTFTSTLKPQVEAYYGTVRLGFPNTSLTLETGEKKKDASEDAEFVHQPFKESLSLTLFKSLKLTQSYSYNREEEYHDSLRFSVSWKNLSASYTQSYTTGYDFEDSKWVAREEKEFLPSSFTLSYSTGTKNLYAWKNRINLGAGLSTNISADLLRQTNSSFTFSPSLSLKIQDFLTLTFSATSKNSSIYKYVKPEIYPETAETNPFVDLMNGFRFDDDSLRESSSFKIKSMNFNLTHEMHDWNFTTSLKIEPKLLTDSSGVKSYTYDPYFSLSIVWNPMSAMKAEITKDYDEEWTQIQLK
ncbi:MAG: hypothetical protein K6E78_06440 [Treponema sp.]|nr:hypothetical protein [Treponema sp.]